VKEIHSVIVFAHSQARTHAQTHYIIYMYTVHAGKVYYEATVTDEGLCRIGWSTKKATHELGDSINSWHTIIPLTTIGKDEHGFGYGGTGKKSFSSQFDNYGEVSSVGYTSSCSSGRCS